MAVDGARETATADGELAPDRASGVVEIVEREAKPVEGAVELGGVRSQELEIDTDLEGVRERNALATPKSDADRKSAAAVEETIIEVSDDEIEAAEPPAPRLTLPSPSLTSNTPSAAPPSLVQRSRPPARPSLRPRPPLAASSLPPPLRASLPAPPPLAVGSLQSPGIPREDPWVRANLALELSRARARILELEEQVAYRDARLVTLEERLEAAERKLEELGAPGSQGRAARIQGAGARALEVTRVQRAVSAAPEAAVAPMKRSRDEQARRTAGQPLPGKRAVPMPEGRVSKVDASSSRQEAELRTAAPGAAPRPMVARAGVDAIRPAAGGAGAGAGQPLSAKAQAPAPEAPKAQTPMTGAPKTEAEAPKTEPGKPRDGELRLVAGIGPRFEAALRKLGITRLSQIAAWSEADLRQVAKALKIPKSRIVKGRWVESAREAIGAPRVSE